MTLDELLGQARGFIRDQTGKEWYSDDDLTTWLNEAAVEACRRSRLLVSSTAPFCEVAVKAHTHTYTVDPAVVLIERARLRLQTEPLWVASPAEMDLYMPGWTTMEGTPRYFIPDYEIGSLRLSPTPIVDDTLSLTVQHEPVKPMRRDADTPPFIKAAHPQLIDWVLYRAYSQHDADTYDPVKAADYYAKFETEFGPRIDYSDQATMQAGYPRSGTYGQDARMGGPVLTKPKPSGKS